MAFQQQSEVHFPGNAPPAADASRGATAFPASQHPQSSPSSYLRPVTSQPHGHPGVVRDAAFPPNAVGNRQPDWEDIPPPVEVQGQPQDLRYTDIGYYNIVDGHPLAHEHRGHAINNYAGVALDVSAHRQAAQAAPPAPEIDVFYGPARNAAAGPARAFLDERPHQGPVSIGLANEVLRQLAIVYLREPNSQLVTIRMEPGHADRVRVVIALELADL